MIKFKIDILTSLKEAGYNQTLLQGGLLPKSTIQALKDGRNITLESLNKVCMLTGLQPGDLLEYVEVATEKEKFLNK
jgi:hypothetical protein|nr:MAG TPA: PrgX, peptide, inhibitor, TRANSCRIPTION.0A [Caudoviricetes sp.]